MRILQVSNLVSHHQIPLAREIAKTVGVENFRFVATQPPDANRLRLGWSDGVDDPWILRAGQVEAERLEFDDWWNTADVVLSGERLLSKMETRLQNGKLCLYTSERWWKPPIGAARLFHPNFLRMALQFRKLSQHSLFHYLPKGPFACADIKILAEMNGRMWKWGYFTENGVSSSLNLTESGPLRILWAGRMLGWKKVDTLLNALALYRDTGRAFMLTLVGDGPDRQKLEQLASKLSLNASITFHEPLPAAKIPELMRTHHVYVLPSTGQEGWGAVVNEAMGSGCAVVASRTVGSAAAIIEHGVNGVLFRTGDWRELAQHLCYLEDNKEHREKLGHEAQHSINRLWSPKNAAARLISVSEALLTRQNPFIYLSGPMSIAK